jgi:hypothetical protein
LQVEDLLHGEQGVGGMSRDKSIDILQELEGDELERSCAQTALHWVLLEAIEA